MGLPGVSWAVLHLFIYAIVVVTEQVRNQYLPKIGETETDFKTSVRAIVKFTSVFDTALTLDHL